jgi:glycosyltransferase involved in cell wall biosynthesis
MTLHLAINASELGRGRGGNETFVAGLIEGLAALPSQPETSLLTCEWDGTRSLPRSFRTVDLGPYRRLLFFLYQQTAILNRLEPDWYLSNYYLPLILPCRGAVVVHDLSFRVHPEWFPQSVAWYMRWLVGRAVEQAERVITVSKFSQHELLRFYPEAAGKVAVVPNGIGREFALAEDLDQQRADRHAISVYGVAAPYILAVGNIHPRKNLSKLLDAYLALRRRIAAVPSLVWVGAPRWGSDVLLARARGAGVQLTGFVAQAHLPAFYRQAKMLVYPSLYEGFGLPPVEAMACGTPVITSNTTSLPEVVGDAALKVDPSDRLVLAKAMERLLADAALRRRLSQAGLQRAERYTWPRSAKALLAALE